MADQRPNGLFITDDAGNVYYLRPEILAQAKMPAEDVQKLKDELAAGSKGKDRELSVEDLHTVAGGVSVPMTHLANIPTISHGGTSPVMSSTIMCPW
jgi:hypothetical protein